MRSCGGGRGQAGASQRCNKGTQQTNNKRVQHTDTTGIDMRNGEGTNKNTSLLKSVSISTCWLVVAKCSPG